MGHARAVRGTGDVQPQAKRPMRGSAWQMSRSLERMLGDVERRQRALRGVQRILLQHAYGLRYAMDMTIQALQAEHEADAFRRSLRQVTPSRRRANAKGAAPRTTLKAKRSTGARQP